MFDYFRNCSSNAYQVCCEASPTKGLYNLFSVTFIQGHNWDLHLKLDNCFTSTIIVISPVRQYLSYGIQTWHDGRLVHGMYAYAQQCVARGKNWHWIILTTKQVISIKLATMVGHFLHDLDFENIYMAWPTCYNCSLLVFVFSLYD